MMPVIFGRLDLEISAIQEVIGVRICVMHI